MAICHLIVLLIVQNIEPTAQGMFACDIACPLWRTVWKTVREERMSLTNGRDTTACFAGGE